MMCSEEGNWEEKRSSIASMLSTALDPKVEGQLSRRKSDALFHTREPYSSRTGRQSIDGLEWSDDPRACRGWTCIRSAGLVATRRYSLSFHIRIDVDGRLPHSVFGEFATVSRAIIRLCGDDQRRSVALSGDAGKAHISRSAAIGLTTLDKWHRTEDGNYALSASDSADVIIRVRGDQDEAIPSATSQVIEAMTVWRRSPETRNCGRMRNELPRMRSAGCSSSVMARLAFSTAPAYLLEPLKLVIGCAGARTIPL